VTKKGEFFYEPLFVYDGAGNLIVTPLMLSELGLYTVTVRHVMINDANTFGTKTFTVEILNQDCNQYYWNYYNNHTTQWY